MCDVGVFFLLGVRVICVCGVCVSVCGGCVCLWALGGCGGVFLYLELW